MIEIIIDLIGIVGVLFSIVFSFLACKRRGKDELQTKGKKEGVLITDIAYIKTSIDRMENKLDRVENNYQLLIMRIIKLEENYNNLISRHCED